MKKYIYSINLVVVVLMILSGCKEGNLHSPITKGRDTPSGVKNVKVKNMPGAAKIKYEIPQNEGILYVKAIVNFNQGGKKVVKSSYYKSSLALNGFADTTAYDVKLYTVNREDNVSNPVHVNVKPLTPPLIKIYKSLNMSQGYGGIKVSFEDVDTAKVTVHALAEDSLGRLKIAYRYYTKTGGSFNVRGYPAQKRRFGVYVRDSYGNRSDTLFKEFTPLFEKRVPKDKFKAVHLPSDSYQERPGGYGNGMRDIWDGITNISDPTFFVKDVNFPAWFTFDLGRKVQLERMKVFSRANSSYTSDPKVFEVWGSNDPNPDGSYDSWTKLGDFVAKKPSGAPKGQHTANDEQYAEVHGQDFNFPNPDQLPDVRYVRFKILNTWTSKNTGSGSFIIAELTLWGSNHFE